jgi:hypothetical protein
VQAAGNEVVPHVLHHLFLEKGGCSTPNTVPILCETVEKLNTAMCFDCAVDTLSDNVAK